MARRCLPNTTPPPWQPPRGARKAPPHPLNTHATIAFRIGRAGASCSALFCGVTCRARRHISCKKSAAKNLVLECGRGGCCRAETPHRAAPGGARGTPHLSTAPAGGRLGAVRTTGAHARRATVKGAPLLPPKKARCFGFGLLIRTPKAPNFLNPRSVCVV